MPRPIGGPQSRAFDRTSQASGPSKPQFDQQGANNGCKQGEKPGSPSGNSDSYNASQPGAVFSAADLSSKGNKAPNWGNAQWHRGNWSQGHGGGPNNEQDSPNPFSETTSGSTTTQNPSKTTPSTLTANNGGSNSISDEEINKATNGDPTLTATLKKIASNPDGAKLLRDALNKGVTYSIGDIGGEFSGAAGVTSGSTVKMGSKDFASTVSYVAHETAHAAYPEMDHQSIYETGYKIAKSLGEPENRIDFSSLPENFK